MGVLEGKVAFISGGARGQGRSHAIKMAGEGADIITFDICESFDTVANPGPTEEDLAQTVKEVEALGRRIVAQRADARDQAAVQAVFDQGVSELGRCDIVLANAGIMPIVGAPARKRQAWHDCIDIMITGALHTCEAAIPTLLTQGDGGSIVITSSLAGVKGPMRTLGLKSDGFLGYVVAKHGVVGLMRCYANALGAYKIRCNTVHPTGVSTPMTANEQLFEFMETNPELGEAMRNILPTNLIEPEDVSNMIVYLCSDAARYITGATINVDAGASAY
ncbi:mycofactocin-coupled SDR family oxidoreductase [Mycobacterium sp.]|jgi:SDR family mycofactocin-dependent oxidoreductase|uniref:mycofactocin-coupled SDR family oxidoreductase n=1 Tax=Mycobacterium sp. TaxID=1785 RepID=UPI002B67AC45|nr:mycofactocin-coupled SDR family oxidoreductase [Mycobacterium sp.]HXB86753.1 mycofactocin-coupled SDR family oxidoreductase [Mycobacterium sp.]